MKIAIATSVSKNKKHTSKTTKNLTYNNLNIFNSFNDEKRGSLIQMIKGLDLRLISYLDSLEENDVKYHLSIILEKYKDIIFTKTKFGFTLSTYPLSSLWIVYYDFIQQVTRGSVPS